MNLRALFRLLLIFLTSSLSLAGLITALVLSGLGFSTALAADLVAVDDWVTTDEGESVLIKVLDNDLGIGNITVTLTIAEPPIHGTTEILGNKHVRYTPDPNYNGADSFTYQVCLTADVCASAGVHVTINPVNDTPLAAPDQGTVDEDSSVTINILANDTGLGDTPLTVSIPTAPLNGQAVVNGDLTVTYTPNANYNGADSFRAQVCDTNNDCSEAVINLTINPVNDAPSAVADTASTIQDVQATIDVLANDQDIDGDVLLLQDFQATSANGGTIVRSDNGTPSDLSDDRLIFTPAANFSGTDTFSYTLSDGQAAVTGSVTVTVDSRHDAPLANDDAYQTNQDTALSITAGQGVLSNDVILSGSGLTAVRTGGPSHGTLQLQASGAFIYTPAVGYSGADSFTYYADDGVSHSASATVSLTINPVAPLSASPDEYQIGQDTPLTVPAPGVLGNDNGGALDGITAVKTTSVSHGTLTFNSDGSFTYTPAAGYVGPDSFKYRISNGKKSSPEVSVKIAVLDTLAPELEWTAPVASGEQYQVVETKVTLQVVASDNVKIDHVRFYRWDAVGNVFVDIGTDDKSPYTWELDINTLNPEWNNLFCKAYDAAGNESARKWIFVYIQGSTLRNFRIYLPAAFR